LCNKAVKYCSKECQRKAWKNGHKQECGKLQTARVVDKKDEKAASRKLTAERQAQLQLQLPPLDGEFDPKQL